MSTPSAVSIGSPLCVAKAHSRSSWLIYDRLVSARRPVSCVSTLPLGNGWPQTGGQNTLEKVCPGKPMARPRWKAQRTPRARQRDGPPSPAPPLRPTLATHSRRATYARPLAARLSLASLATLGAIGGRAAIVARPVLFKAASADRCERRRLAPLESPWQSCSRIRLAGWRCQPGQPRAPVALARPAPALATLRSVRTGERSLRAATTRTAHSRAVSPAQVCSGARRSQIRNLRAFQMNSAHWRPP